MLETNVKAAKAKINTSPGVTKGKVIDWICFTGVKSSSEITVQGNLDPG